MAYDLTAPSDPSLAPGEARCPGPSTRDIILAEADGAPEALTAESYQFLILGSGRLNTFQKGGDSLAGRYFLFNLWPITLAELSKTHVPFHQFMNNPLRVGREQPALQNAWTRMVI